MEERISTHLRSVSSLFGVAESTHTDFSRATHRTRKLTMMSMLMLTPGASALHLSTIAPLRPMATMRSSPAVMGLEDDIKATISGNKVVMYSKSYCPFCNQCKGLFSDKGIYDDAKIIELDLVEDGQAIQDTLLAMTGQRTVPNVFINGQHLGGNDDTQKAAKSGKLDELLSAA